MKVFINAPVMNVEQNNLPIFQRLQKELWSHDFESYAPGLLLKKIDPKDYKSYINDCTKIMIGCDLVVSHGDWYEFKECVKLAEIARLLGIEVIHHTGLPLWIKNQSLKGIK